MHRGENYLRTHRKGICRRLKTELIGESRMPEPQNYIYILSLQDIFSHLIQSLFIHAQVVLVVFLGTGQVQKRIPLKDWHSIQIKLNGKAQWPKNKNTKKRRKQQPALVSRSAQWRPQQEKRLICLTQFTGLIFSSLVSLQDP